MRVVGRLHAKVRRRKEERKEGRKKGETSETDPHVALVTFIHRLVALVFLCVVLCVVVYVVFLLCNNAFSLIISNVGVSMFFPYNHLFIIG